MCEMGGRLHPMVCWRWVCATITETSSFGPFPSVSLRGNALRQGSSWRASRGPVAVVLIALCVGGAAVWLYVTSRDSDITETLVSQSELVSPQPRVFSVPCSEDYENYKRYPGEALLILPSALPELLPSGCCVNMSLMDCSWTSFINTTLIQRHVSYIVFLYDSQNSHDKSVGTHSDHHIKSLRIVNSEQKLKLDLKECARPFYLTTIWK